MTYGKFSCTHCNREQTREIKYINLAFKRNKPLFCNLQCFNLHRIKETNVACGNCNKSIYKKPAELKRSQSGKSFCSRTCATISRNKERLGEKHPLWKDGHSMYRINGIKAHGNMCTNPSCEIIKAGIFIPIKLLDVHHKDGNRQNNDIINLQVLCVWCHAKETRKILDISAGG